MGTAIVKAEPAGPSEWTADRVALVKRTIAKDASDDELALFVAQCKRTGLDPFARQIHFIKRSGKMTIQTGIDGYRLVADRTGCYAGNDEPVYDGEGPLKGDRTHPRKATVTVWKIVAGQRCPFVGEARWDEYYPGDGDPGFMWRKMPFGQLGKCAEAKALRKAFPQELSGIYTNDEMDQADAHGEAEGSRQDVARATDPRSAASPKAAGYRGAVKAESPTKPAPDNDLPKNGAELVQRLTEYERKLAAGGVCKSGELFGHVSAQGVSVCGYPADLTEWQGAAIEFAVGVVKAFVALRQKPKAAPPTRHQPDPTNGVALMNRVRELGVQAHLDELCAGEGDLLDHLDEFMKGDECPHDLAKVTTEQVKRYWQEARDWVAKRRERQAVPV